MPNLQWPVEPFTIVSKILNRVHMSVRIFKQYPLLVRLVCYVIVFSLFVAMFLTVIRLWIIYTDELETIRQNLVELQGSHADSLIKNIWNMDQDGIDIQLKSIKQFPDVTAVVLVNSYGDRFQSGEIPVKKEDLIVHSFSLAKEFNERSVALGTVTIYASSDHLRLRLLQHVPLGLVTELIVLFLSGVFILGLFLFHYNRHINKIAKFAGNLKISTLDQELYLDRKESASGHRDELDRIVSSLNEMRRRLNDGVCVQQQTEQQLLREKVFSDAIINSLPGLFVVYSEDLKAILFNDMYREKLGLSEDQIQVDQFLDRVVTEDREKLSEAIQHVFATHRPVSVEVEILSPDQSRIPYLINCSLFEYEEKKYLIGMSTDITERKKNEEALRQSQKIEAIGTLAGGIAHDFNNILAAIIGNIELARAAHLTPEKLDKYLSSGLGASLRARDLVEQILSIGRRGQQKKQALQVAGVVKEVVKLLRATIPTTIAITSEIDCERLILADATQIHQVILNLCTNGYHAMQESGGCLNISLSERIISKKNTLTPTDVPVGEYLCVEISDTGCGMDKATQKMIFEPYFTTKKSGEGTGLGLAVVHGIVQGHDGHITVKSRPGRGTTFTLLFPLLADQEVVAAVPVALPEIQGGTERILLVDDEQEILDVISELLGAQGYRVTQFVSSLEALRHFRKEPSRFDLVITDMSMPNLSGEFLGKKIMAIRPDIPLILCTGFSKTMSSSQSRDDGFSAYLTKPLESRTLLRTIREVLDKSEKSRLDVLLVDDDPFNQRIVTLLLEHEGHNVIVADNGQTALKKLTEQRFDIIFMDMQMPILDGLQATMIIRDCEKKGMQSKSFEQWAGIKSNCLQGGHIPVIALTGNLDDESRRQCQEAGMDEFIAKPFTRETVSRIIHQVTKFSFSGESRDGCRDEDKSARKNDMNGEDLRTMARKHLQSVYPLEERQIAELVDESVRSVQQSIQDGSQALAQNRLDILEAIAHKIKGTLMGLGLAPQVELARMLQEYARKNDIEEYSSVFRYLTRSLKSLVGEGDPDD